MEELLHLFDQNWFKQNLIISKNPEKSQEQPNLSRNSSQLLVRSFSDQFCDNFCSKGSGSPDSVLTTTENKLQNILSGKDFDNFADRIEEEEQGREIREMKLKKRNRKEKRGLSKSLSELEFEELKGFMDLGFVFSEKDKDSSLVSIIPGLQRFREKQGNKNNDDKCEISRPYLSEAWEIFGQKKEEVNPLMKWSITSISNDIDMKNNLRIWAHTVASTVR